LANPADSTTSLSLLEKIRLDPSDATVWREFVTRYRPKIYGWCLDRGLQPSDGEDVTQIVFVKLMEKMRDFKYDASGSFRSWLRTVTNNAASDFLDAHRRAAGSGDSEVLSLLNNIEARSDLARRLGELFDHELLEAAMGRVRERVKGSTWEAFRLTALEGKAAAAVGQELGIPVAHVFVAKNRVQKMIEQEIQALDRPCP
jgi:RNA polymerase sigma factor (sigma-70 family)